MEEIPITVVVADLDDDGYLDLALTVQSSGNVAVFAYDG